MDSSANNEIGDHVFGNRHVMPSGIPVNLEYVSPLEEGNSDLVYRDVSIMNVSSVNLFGDSLVSSKTQDLGLKPTIFNAPLLAPKLVVCGKYKMGFVECESAVQRKIEQFLEKQSITATHKSESDVHIWNCYTISDCCQYSKFNVLMQPQAEGFIVEFKRERGCCEIMSNVFQEFQKTNGECAGKPQRGLRSQPPPLEDESDSMDCSSVEESLRSVSSWIKNVPIEGLQTVGLLYSGKCKHVLRNDNILMDVCNIIQDNGGADSDMVVLALAFACLRKILQSYSQNGRGCPLDGELLVSLKRSLVRASSSNDATARKQAAAAELMLTASDNNIHL